MSACVAYSGRRARWLLAVAGLFLLVVSPVLAADPVPVSSTGGSITVHLDQARILQVPERTATLVVGNPLIADASVQPGGVLVITGKSYGATNLVALDRSGRTLLDHVIEVQGPRDNVVVVYRGIERESYSCMPNCERRITLGDSAGYFSANLTQSGNLNTQAQGGAQR
jgi:Flp pilus assembly secretin CpaC